MFKYHLRSAGGMPGHRNKTWLQTERDLPLTAGTTDGAGTALVKADKELSKLNGRLYRMCRTYDVSFSALTQNLASSNHYSYQFYTLPNTWFVHNAIKNAYDIYMQSMQDELNAGVRMARWHDFKIDEQDPDGIWDFLNVGLFDGDAWADISADETVTDSSVTDSGGTAKTFNLMGNETNSYNIFSEYSKLLKYGRPTDESVSSDQPYDGLLDVKDADVLAERGDQAPYDRDFSSFLHDGTDDQNIMVFRDALIVNADTASRTRTKMFTAPLGIVWVVKEVGDTATDIGTATPEICMHVKAGAYKGVHSHSMTE